MSYERRIKIAGLAARGTRYILHHKGLPQDVRGMLLRKEDDEEGSA